jgi:hypothetical protein
MRRKPSSGLRSMAEAGRLDICFEQLVIGHPDLFTPEAVAMAKANLAAVKKMVRLTQGAKAVEQP